MRRHSFNHGSYNLKTMDAKLMTMMVMMMIHDSGDVVDHDGDDDGD